MKRDLTRRDFVRLLAISGAGAALAGCAPPAPQTSPPTTAPTAAAASGGSAPSAAPAATAVPAGVSTAPAAASGERPVIRLAGGAAQGVFEPPQPFGIRTGPAFNRMMLLFDALAWRDSTTKPIPWLAEKWTSNADGTEWTFNLRPGVKFQDGQPLTAEDVVFSYDYIAAHATSWFSSMVEAYKSAEVLDDKTVRITLKKPYAPFLSGIAANVPIIPKHIWSGVSDPVKFADQKAFIGSGPYRLASMNQADSSFLFTANDDFFLGAPYVQRLEYLPAGDELVALKAGSLDMANPLPTVGLSNEALAPFKADLKYAILQAPGEGTTALHFNLTRGEPYNNVLFRQAVFYAIDRQELVQRVLGGNGDPGSPGFLAPSNPFGNKDVEQYAYSVDKAKGLLDQAGYKEQNGQRLLPNGSPLGFSLLFPANAARTAQLVRDQLAKVGIKVDLKSVDPGTANQLQSAGNYDVSLVTYGGLGGDPDLMRRAFDSPDQAKFWWKAWGYHNPDFTKVDTEQIQTLDDARRKQLVGQMEQIIAKDVPVMPLYYPYRYVIYVPKVFDAWYFTPLWNPLPTNKQAFVTGQKTGLAIKGG